MNLPQICRFLVQFSAMALFIFQLTMALLKFKSNPTVVTTSWKNNEDIIAPTIMVCPTDQYDWFLSKDIGYTFRTNFHLGILDNTTEYLSWEGSQGIPFETLKENLFQANFDSITIDGQGLTIQDRFLVSQGNCKEVNLKNQSRLNTITVRSKGKAFEILITDPAKSMIYKISTLSMIGDALVQR